METGLGPPTHSGENGVLSVAYNLSPVCTVDNHAMIHGGTRLLVMASFEQVSKQFASWCFLMCLFPITQSATSESDSRGFHVEFVNHLEGLLHTCNSTHHPH